MHPNALNELIGLIELVEAGELPESAIPRLCYFGHKVIGSYRNSTRNLKCTSCRDEWSVKEDHRTEEFKYADLTCSQCQSDKNVYDITGDDQIARWWCEECAYEWQAVMGYKCPECGAERQVPYWSCKPCEHNWQQIDRPENCPKCNKRYE